MLRLIKYSSNADKRYKVLPIVLVIVTRPFSSITFQREFTTSSKGFLLEANSKFWAKQCVLLTADVVSDHLHQATLDPLAALEYFLTHHRLRQVPQQHSSDPTNNVIFCCKENPDKRSKSKDLQIKHTLPIESS
jgi:hypothetical protein